VLFLLLLHALSYIHLVVKGHKLRNCIQYGPLPLSTSLQSPNLVILSCCFFSPFSLSLRPPSDCPQTMEKNLWSHLPVFMLASNLSDFYLPKYQNYSCYFSDLNLRYLPIA
jgi:hypothetical protein